MEGGNGESGGFDRRSFIMAGTIVPSLTVASAASAQGAVDTSASALDFQEFVPIEPVAVDKVRRFNAGTMSEVYWASLTEPQRRLLLPLQAARTSILKQVTEGQLSYVSANASGAKGVYQVIVDYMRYSNVPAYSGNNIIGRALVGTGLRAIANITTMKTNLNLNGLLPIGIRASREDLMGSLETKSIGIISSKIAPLMLLPSSIDETSVAKALESVGAMKVLFEDDNSVSVPHVLAVSRENAQNPAAVLKSLM